MPDKTWYVLVADNDREEVSTIQSQLERRNIQVLAVEEGKDVLEALNTDPQPDAVIMDADMSASDLDGQPLLKAIRNGEQPTIPVFLLSDNDHAMKESASGADKSEKYLRRPFDIAQFLIAASNAGLSQADTARSGNSNSQHATYMDRSPAVEAHNSRTIASRSALTRKTPDQNAEIGWELRKYWRVFLRRKWHLMIVIAVAIAASVFISQQLTPIYETTSTIRVASAAGGQFDYGASMLATRLANTYVEIATSAPILEELAQRLGIEEAPDIEVEPVPETELLEITASHDDPQIAQDAANHLAEIMVERSLTLYAGDAPTARELLEEQVNQTREDLDAALEEYTRLLEEVNEEGEDTTVTASQLEVLAQQVSLRQDLYADVLQRYEEVRSSEELRGNAITIVELAELPEDPASPNIIFNAILGAVGGVIAGLLLVIGLESLSNKVSSPSEIQTLTGLPMLGQIPKMGLTKRRFPDMRRNHDLVDTFQSIQVRLQLSNQLASVDTPIILVTSPEPGTGKTTVATNLALSLARSDHKVILVDADLHRPRIHRIFNFDAKVGLCDVLAGDEMPDSALKQTAQNNLRVLTSGDTTRFRELTGLTSVNKFKLVFRSLADKCDYLVVDAPGLLATGYSAALAKQANAIVLVAAQHYTDPDTLELSMQLLWDIEANVAGVVVNRAELGQPYAYRYSRK